MMFVCELWSLMECIFSTNHWNFFKEQNNTSTNTITYTLLRN